MKRSIKTLTLIVGFSSLLLAAKAQLVVWSTQSFTNDFLSLNYGAFVDFQGGENVICAIISPGDNPNDQAEGIAFYATQPNINFQTTGVPYPASGNTSTYLGDYTLSFDLQVTGSTVSPASGIQIELYPNQAAANGYACFGPHIIIPNSNTNIFTAGTGYQHYSFNLTNLSESSFNVTATNFSFGVGYVAYPANVTSNGEEFDFANVQLTMATNAAPPPKPTLSILPTKPGLRIFQKCSDSIYTQEGIGTVDTNQSWVGRATPGTPVSYAITFADFDTVAGYTMNVQFSPGAGSGDPFGVYNAANDFVWRITSGGGASGFTTGIAFKTNSPANVNGGETNIVVPTTTTTSTNGRGTWTLSFTSNTNGTVTAPDGTVAPFVLDANVASQFTNGITILFGTTAGQTAGYGQYLDISRLAITNVVDGNEFDDFTKDTTLNTNLWNPNFSRDNPAYGNDAGSVFLLSSNTPWWINWNSTLGAGYGLSTKASLSGGTNVWFSPDYYGSGTGAANSIPSLMGTTLRWTLIPTGCLPTVDGTTNGLASISAFFRLQNPPPAQ